MTLRNHLLNLILLSFTAMFFKCGCSVLVLLSLASLRRCSSIDGCWLSFSSFFSKFALWCNTYPRWHSCELRLEFRTVQAKEQCSTLKSHRWGSILNSYEWWRRNQGVINVLRPEWCHVSIHLGSVSYPLPFRQSKKPLTTEPRRLLILISWREIVK